MPTVTPPPPHVPSAPVSGAVKAAAILLNAPAQTLQALQALQTGQSLQATLAALPAPNQIQVQTALGLLTLQTPLNVPQGAVLTLVVGGSSPQPPGQLTFHISAVNGKPVTGGSLGAATTQGAAAPQALPLSAGQTVTATLLRPALGVAPSSPSAGATAPAAAQTGPHGAAIPGSPVPGGAPGAQAAPQTTPTATQAATQAAQAAARPGGAAPATTPPSAQGTTQGATQGGGTAQSATPPAAPPQATTTTLASGTRFTATVQRIDAPSAAVSTPAALAKGAGAKALASGQVMTGTVTGRTAGGQAIVQTPSATFALGSATANTGALGEGAKITFRLDSAPLSPAASAAAQLRTLGGTHQLVSAKSWDDLGEALKAMVGADPARLAQVAQTALPQPGAKLSSQMLFFLSALKGGDLKGLFGSSALRVIDKERPGLLSRLGGDFHAMSRLADEPQQGDWRLALIPLWTGERLEQLRFFWRGRSGEEDAEDGEETRFVLDVELSNLGHLQIDGLVKAKRHHLDLIIRTDQPLPETMRADIAALFQEARETLGLGGQVAFQAAPANFIATPTEQKTGPGANAHPEPGGFMAAHTSDLLA